MAPEALRLTPAGRLLPRALRPAETVLDVDGILDAYERAREVLLATAEASRAELIDALIAGTPRPPEPASRPRRQLAVMWALYELGRWHAAGEARALGVEPMIDDPDWAEPGERAMARTSSNGADRLDRVIGWADRGLRAGSIPPRDVTAPWVRLRGALGASDAAVTRRSRDLLGIATEALEREVTRAELNRVPGLRSAVAGVLSEPFDRGLDDLYRRHADAFGGWQYSAVLDGGTCPVCAPLDGTVYETLDELYAVLPGFGPNPSCRGGLRCRCRGVPLPPEEEVDRGASRLPGYGDVIEHAGEELTVIQARELADGQHAILARTVRGGVVEVRMLSGEYRSVRRSGAPPGSGPPTAAAPPRREPGVFSEAAEEAIETAGGVYHHRARRATVPGYEHIEIAVEEGLNAPTHLRALRRHLDAYDPAELAGLRQVRFLAQRNPADAYWAKRYEMPGFTSRATGGAGGVNFWGQEAAARSGNQVAARLKGMERDIEERKAAYDAVIVPSGTFDHEMGHVLGERSGIPGSLRQEWMMAREVDREAMLSLEEDTGGRISGGGMQPGYVEGLTPYGRVAEAEDWAEAFRLYMLDRREGAVGWISRAEFRELRFADVAPGRSALIDRWLAAVRRTRGG